MKRLIMIALAAFVAWTPPPSWAFWPFDHPTPPRKTQRLATEDATPSPAAPPAPASKKRPAPPPADYMARECDPIRQKIVALNQRKGLVHLALKPRISYLKERYKRCGDRFREREYRYLKHATIEIPDPLPPLNTTATLNERKAR